MTIETNNDIEQHPLRIVRPKEATRLLGVSIDTLYRLRKKPGFPKPVSLTGSTERNASVGFLLKDLENWIKYRAQESGVLVNE